MEIWSASSKLATFIKGCRLPYALDAFFECVTTGWATDMDQWNIWRSHRRNGEGRYRTAYLYGAFSIPNATILFLIDIANVN
jgi:hypothetical protein